MAIQIVRVSGGFHLDRHFFISDEDATKLIVDLRIALSNAASNDHLDARQKLVTSGLVSES